MNKILVSLISAAVGAAVSWFITKRVYEKKMDDLANATVEEVQAMHEQITNLHKVFVEEQPIEVADARQKTWDQIAEASGSTIGKTDAEVVKEFRDNILAAREQKERENDITGYAVETAQYTSDPVNPDTYKGPSIYLITELEYEDGDPGYSKEEWSMWLKEEGIYDEYGEPVDAVKGFIGLTYEELAESLPHPASSDPGDIERADWLYYRNENLRTDYAIHINREGYSDFFTASPV